MEHVQGPPLQTRHSLSVRGNTEVTVRDRFPSAKKLLPVQAAHVTELAVPYVSADCLPTCRLGEIP